MTTNTRQSHETDSLSQEQTRNTDSKLQTLDNEQLNQVNGGSIFSTIVETMKKLNETISGATGDTGKTK